MTAQHRIKSMDLKCEMSIYTSETLQKPWFYIVAPVQLENVRQSIKQMCGFWWLSHISAAYRTLWALRNFSNLIFPRITNCVPTSPQLPGKFQGAHTESSFFTVWSLGSLGNAHMFDYTNYTVFLWKHKDIFYGLHWWHISRDSLCATASCCLHPHPFIDCVKVKFWPRRHWKDGNRVQI